MSVLATDSPQAMAHVLAWVLIADAEFTDGELMALDQLGVCDRIGISREEFLDIAGALIAAQAQRQGQPGTTRVPDPPSADDWLAAVDSPGLRLLVARLAAGLIVADGRVSGGERRLYLRMLARWGLSEQRVAEAMRAERRPFADALLEP
jgi:hypothetical protein